MLRRLFWAVWGALALVGCQKAGGVCGGDPHPSVPGPDFACTAQVAGSMVCPRGQIGWGYECMQSQCWRLFVDGPCAPPFVPSDAGAADAGPDAGSCSGVLACTVEGGRQCSNAAQLECRQGCWVEVGACVVDAGMLCAPSGFPVAPDLGCSASLTGANICPAGPSAGYGYQCSDAGCWQSFSDGECVEPGDAGSSCSAARRCAEEGAVECRSGLRSWCYGGCWVDTGACSDAGVTCGFRGPQVPTERCTAARLDTAVCPAGPGSGYGYTCTALGCWSGFLDGPCSAPLDGGSDAGMDGG